MKTKLWFFRTLILATLLYRSETWLLLAPHLKRLQVFVMGCLRVILGVSQWDKKRNSELWCLGGPERVKVMVMRRRLRRLGHMERMDIFHLSKCLLVSRPLSGKR